MTTLDLHPAAPTTRERRIPLRRTLLHALAPLLLATTMTLLCLRAAGPSQGAFFGGVAFAILIVPPFVAAERTTRERAIVAAATIMGVSIGWLFALPDLYVTWQHWVGAVAVLAAVVSGVAGFTASLRAARLPVPLAAAVTTVLFSLWLTWPIWLSPHLAGRESLVNTLTVAHPLFALDHLLADLGQPWTERTTMYNEWSVLNQDVAYSLPTTILWTILLHATIGAAGMLLGSRPLARSTAPSAAAPPSTSHNA